MICRTLINLPEPTKETEVRPFYLTTPIYYVNANPHLGHAYTSIIGDAAIRMAKMAGRKTLFLTGTDEHGDKIVQAAEKKRLSPQEFVDKISANFRSLWPCLSVEADFFERTTSPSHVRAVQTFLQRIYDAGDIYFGEFGGHYCYGCERFYTEKELENGLCPQHQTPPQFISEKNYFFRMSKYLPWLRSYLEENPDLIRPERYRSEALAMLEGGVLEDLCISRPKTRLTWGIELPFDRDYVCYVWFDALVTYLSGIGWPDGPEFAQFWPGEHLIAKDILKPHAIFWPCMLRAAGLPIYRHLNVHGYWLSRDTKMSKSLGNVVDPLDAIRDFGLDAFRFFLMRDMRFGQDASFSDEAIVTRVNADLANDLGNLFSRALSMNGKYFDGMAPKGGSPGPAEEEIVAICLDAVASYAQLFRQWHFSRALEALWTIVSALNKYIDASAPWALFKKGETARLAAVMATILACLRKIAICLWPVMPETARKMLGQLGQPVPEPGVAPVADIDTFASSFDYIAPGTSIATSSALFPRLEKRPEQPARKAEPEQKGRPEASFDSFRALDIATGTILKAEKHPDADKLLRLEIDFGEEKSRQIISGIAEFFKPEDLPGRRVCAILNLPPRKIRGLISQGMVLTAETKGKVELICAPDSMPNGSRIA